MDWIARLLLWLEPYLARGLEMLENGSPLGILLALPAGVALGLSPLTYPLIPVVIGYAARGEPSVGERAALSVAFVLGITTVYTALGVAFGTVGLTLMSFLNRSIWLWFALVAPFLWIMGLRLVGFLRFGVPLLRTPDPETGPRGLSGAYLLGLPFGLAGCPTCALILPSMLVAVAAGGDPVLGALTLFLLGFGQGVILVTAGTFAGSLPRLARLAPYRLAMEKVLGVALLLTAAYFTWRALIWL